MENKNENLEIIWAEYNRRSSDEGSGKQIISIERQQEELELRFPRSIYKRTYHLWESRSAFVENNRPKFSQLVQLIREGKVTGIICWHPDRLSRNPLEAAIIVDLIIKGLLKEIRFGSYTFDNSPEGIMLLQFALSQSQYFSAKLSRDVKSGNKSHLQRGQWITVAKPGYLNKENPITKEKYIDKDPERFELIKNAFGLLFGGERPMSVLRKLNDEWGYRTRKTKNLGDRRLSKASFYRIISDPFYYGDMVRKEGIFPGNHPAMITQEQFEKLQVMLGRKGRSRYCKTEFAYKEILTCGECGGAVTCEEKWQIICPSCKTKFHKGKDTDACPNCHQKLEDMGNAKLLHYIFYHCTKRVHKNCTQGGISLANLEKRIDTELQKFEIDKNFRDWAIDHLNELNSREEQQQDSIKEKLDKQLSDCDWSIRNLIKIRIRKENVETYEDVETQKYYSEEEHRLLEEKKDLKKQIDLLDKRQEDWMQLTKETFDFAFYARQNFATGDVATKTQILSRLGQNLTIKDRELRIDGQNAFFLIEKGKNEIREIVNSLEPNKIPISSKEMLCLDSVCQTVRRGRDLNPRVLFRRTLSKRVE